MGVVSKSPTAGIIVLRCFWLGVDLEGVGFQILMATEFQRRRISPNAGEEGAASAKKGGLNQAESRPLL